MFANGLQAKQGGRAAILSKLVGLGSLEDNTCKSAAVVVVA